MSGKRILTEKVLKLPRPYPDAYVEWHLQMFDANEEIAFFLWNSKIHYADFTDDEMARLGINVGPRLEVDDVSIDFDTRFFAPAPMKTAKRLVAQASETKRRVWPRLGYTGPPRKKLRNPIIDQPIPTHPSPKDVQWLHAHPDLVMSLEVRPVLDRLVRGTREETWAPFGGRLEKDVSRKVRRAGAYGCVPQSDGTELEEHFESFVDSVLFVNRDRGTTPPPHVVIELGQTQTPSEDRPTRFEIHAAAGVLRYMLLNRHWLHHHTLPVLVISYHGHGCRIVQIHLKEGKMVARVSRILNLTRHKHGTITDDAHIALRWLLSTPIGQTRFGDCTTINSSPERDGAGHSRSRPTASLSLAEGDNDWGSRLRGKACVRTAFLASEGSGSDRVTICSSSGATAHPSPTRGTRNSKSSARRSSASSTGCPSTSTCRQQHLTPSSWPRLSGGTGTSSRLPGDPVSPSWPSRSLKCPQCSSSPQCRRCLWCLRTVRPPPPSFVQAPPAPHFPPRTPLAHRLK